MHKSILEIYHAKQIHKINMHLSLSGTTPFSQLYKIKNPI